MKVVLHIDERVISAAVARGGASVETFNRLLDELSGDA